MNSAEGNDFDTLLSLGWKPVFSQGISLEELASQKIGRITAIDRNHVHLTTDEGECIARLGGRWFTGAASSATRPAVGDWALTSRTDNPNELLLERLLERVSVLKRTAPGQENRASVAVQLLCANVDTVFVVSALGPAFNMSSVERYVALVQGSGVLPVVVLTKSDLHADPQVMTARVENRVPNVDVIAVNGTSHTCRQKLEAWLHPGDTVALLGPSGVGKSTLINTLAGVAIQATAAVRLSDQKGRHTTTRRSLERLPNGACLIDTPGMRELRLALDDASVDSGFADISALARSCRFANCSHRDEPGCAVLAAIARGDLDRSRAHSYEKIMADAKQQERLVEPVYERRARERAFGKMARTAQRRKNDRTGRT